MKAKLKSGKDLNVVIKNWTKKYETSFRIFLSYIYKNEGSWDSLTYNEIVEIIREPNDEVLGLIKSIFQNLTPPKYQ